VKSNPEPPPTQQLSFPLEDADLRRDVGRLLQRLTASTKVDLPLVTEAIEFGFKAHDGQLRKNGKPYFIHPVRVALRAAEYDLDTHSIIGCLLHDVIEDTPLQSEDIEDRFGPSVSRLVEALTKVKTSKNLTFYKIFELGNVDFRVILIKLMDRLDNLGDLEALARHKQRRIAAESLALYGEVAHGLGLIEIEEELRGLVFRQIYPRRYQKVLSQLNRLELDRNQPVNQMIDALQQAIDPALILGLTPVKLNPQNFFYLDHAVDRLLSHFVLETKSPLDCYTLLGQVHTCLRNIPLSIRDFISNPRANGWRGITTKVMICGEQVDLQIVTTDFQENNRKGLITLLQDNVYQSENFKQFFQLYLDVSADDNLRIDDVFRSSKALSIQCMTPKGDLIELRYGATILDFAFAVHSELGIKTLGGIVNNIRYPRHKVLEDGMVIQVLTGESVIPDEGWLHHVVMPKSRRELLRFSTKHHE